eukprot:Skav209632  [mRNA]  locus=scaffold2751:31246:32202:+ [translate_table: standard]
MTLLVDATTPLLDVEQAHLSFVRRSDDADSSMPSLRRIIQPTDWGTVRSQLREFALTAGSMQSAATQRNVLKMKLRLQDDAKRCVEAREVQVSGFSPPVTAGADEPILKKLGLQIGRFKVVTKPKPRRMGRSIWKQVIIGLCFIRFVFHFKYASSSLKFHAGHSWLFGGCILTRLYEFVKYRGNSGRISLLSLGFVHR